MRQQAGGTEPAVRLVVLESGSRFARLAPPDDGDEGDLVVVSASATTSPMGLARQVIERLHRLHRSSRRVASLVIAVGPERGDSLLTSRLLVARAAIRSGLLAGGGRLVFDAAACGGLDTQYELVSLAGVLTAELGGEDVCITVRLGASARDAFLPLAKISGREDHPVAALSSPA